MYVKPKVIGFVTLFFVVFVEPAQAYLDPGTGSMILQLILGGVVSVVI